MKRRLSARLLQRSVRAKKRIRLSPKNLNRRSHHLRTLDIIYILAWSRNSLACKNFCIFLTFIHMHVKGRSRRKTSDSLRAAHGCEILTFTWCVRWWLQIWQLWMVWEKGSFSGFVWCNMHEACSAIWQNMSATLGILNLDGEWFSPSQV